MKKLILSIASLAVALSGLATEPADQVKAINDSVSRELGKFFAYQVQAMYANYPDASKEEFLKGMQAGFANDTSRTSYLDGLSMALQTMKIAQQMHRQQGFNVDLNAFADEFRTRLYTDSVPSADKVRQAQVEMVNNMDRFALELKANSHEALANAKAGEQYIAQLLKRDKKFKRTASGIAYKLLQPGKGSQFQLTDTVDVGYRGTHIDGKQFDANERLPMQLTAVVPGFREALSMMRPGAKMIVVIPAHLAYGVKGHPPVIGPNETLQFEITTHSLSKPKTETKE